MITKPLLAARIEDDEYAKLRFPLYASRKIDGWRVLFTDKGPLTRKFKPIANLKVRAELSDPRFIGFDGEIVVGPANNPHVFNTTQSVLSTVDGPGLSECDGKVLVFDDFTHPELPFAKRLVSAMFRVPPEGLLEPVLHIEIANQSDLDSFEGECLSAGYEGVMLRDPGGKYKCGRSTFREHILMKVKRFVDVEAVITGYEELMHNDNPQTRNEVGSSKRSSHKANMRPGNILGALTVTLTDGSGMTCNVGSGFTLADRKSLWAIRDTLINKVITIKYQKCGTKDSPRMPIFKGFRND